jgi:hypothetical protein
MRSPATLLTLVLLLASRPLSISGQETPPPRPQTPADSARVAKADRKAAERAAERAAEDASQAAKDAERARKEAEEAPPATVTVASLPRSERPTMSVLAFRYGTVTNTANYGVKLPRGVNVGTVVIDPVALAHEDNQTIGVGIAEMLKAELTSGESFRIIEPRPLGEAGVEDLPRREPVDPQDSVAVRRRESLRTRLLLTGAVTRYGSQDKVMAVPFLSKKYLAGAGYASKRTIVELTAQVQDASTGEVLLSVTGFGMSHKGGGVVAAGGNKNGIAGFATGTSAAAVAIGEATRLAVQDLAAKMTNARAVLLSALKES